MTRFDGNLVRHLMKYGYYSTRYASICWPQVSTNISGQLIGLACLSNRGQLLVRFHGYVTLTMMIHQRTEVSTEKMIIIFVEKNGVFKCVSWCIRRGECYETRIMDQFQQTESVINVSTKPKTSSYSVLHLGKQVEHHSSVVHCHWFRNLDRWSCNVFFA